MKTFQLNALLLIALGAFAFNARASDETACTKEPKSKWMAEKDINAHLVAQGYTVKRVKTEGHCYEAYVIDKTGKRSEILLDPVTGKSVGREGGESRENE